MNCRSIAVALAALSLLSGCAASSKTFYASPAKVKDTQLCRTYLEAVQKGDQQFASDTAQEAVRRGLTQEACEKKVATENGVLIATALVATAVGVGVACQNGCSGGGYSPSYASNAYTDYDCAGGPGDGPYWVQGPINMNGQVDTHGLDADGDGIGCEPYGDFGS